MPSISTSQNEPGKKEKKIAIIQEKVLGKQELSKILKEVHKKNLSAQVISSNKYMDDSDTDVSDNFSLHESEDSPIEDNGYSEEEKVEMGIQETYLEKTITENAEKEKAEEAKKIERMNEEKLQIGSFLLVKFFNKEI